MSDSYDYEQRINDEDKSQMNEDLKNVHDRFNIDSGEAIVLDTPALNTTQTLISVGYRKRDCMIPNPYVYDELKGVHENTHDMLLGTFLDDIKEFAQGEITSAPFDYCCSLDGNNDMSPKDDVRKYFKYGLPSDDSVLLLNLSFRGSNSPPYVQADKIRAISFVQKIAKDNGYVAELQWRESRTYRSRYTIIFYVHTR